MSCCDPLLQIINRIASGKNKKPFSDRDLKPPKPRPAGTHVDKKATRETSQLFANLQTQFTNKTMFGHQDTTAYGVGWEGNQTTEGAASKSDIQGTCGEFPAVYGWDLGATGGVGPTNIDGVPFADMKKWIKEAYSRGGLNTISMHLDNPATKGYKSAWDTTPAVPQILPGGEKHNEYLKTLDNIAIFLKELKTDDGTYIPIVLRMYHEYNQKWSWWSKAACSEKDFKSLWQMTVKHFRDTHNIHHLLYAISPQDTDTETKYLERYLGDEWCDILGLDWYMLKPDNSWSWLGRTLSMLVKLGIQKKKPVALTEVGFGMRVPCADWWSRLLKALQYDKYSRQTAWALVWRNQDEHTHFGPYPDCESAADFKSFRDSKFTVFEREVKELGLYSA